jgi:RNA polymerase sigma-70 factor (ECF subfamily)
VESSGAGLVERARRGDQEAWTTLYRRAYPRLVAFAHRRLGSADLAREAVSETMVRAVSAIDSYSRDDDGFTPWLFGICRHVVADIHRFRYREAHERLTRIDGSVAGPLDALLENEERSMVRVAFDRLEADERELLELRVVAGLSAAEVAGVMGKRPGAVRMAQMRALSRLRVFVEEVSRVG